jgi:glycosyltransferase involved in cell wall biosynthesis
MSVLDQELTQADFEVIVVNDSGKALEGAGWQNSPRVRVINTNRRERSFARNSGAAVARGDYLAFLDDDDWLLPGALDSFWQLASQHKESAWLYGGIKIVDEDERTLAVINSGLNGDCFAQIMGGAWAPIQSSLIKVQVFFALGGFNPFICGTEDEDLCRRVAFQGTFANSSAVVACLYRGPSWNTSTNYLRAPEDTRYSRDLILGQPQAFKQLMRSANADYWYGRICRVYLSTINWNMGQRRFFTALSRALYAASGFVLSARCIFSKAYWKGIKAEHAPHTLHFVMHAYERGESANPSHE